MDNTPDEDSDENFIRHLLSSLEATRIRAYHLGQSALNNPAGTASDAECGKRDGGAVHVR